MTASGNKDRAVRWLQELSETKAPWPLPKTGSKEPFEVKVTRRA